MSNSSARPARDGDEFDFCVYASADDIGSGNTPAKVLVNHVDHTKWINAIELKEVMLDGVPLTGSVPTDHMYILHLSGGFWQPHTSSNASGLIDGFPIVLTGSRTHHIYDSRFVGKFTSATSLKEFTVRLQKPDGTSVQKDDLSGLYLAFRCYTGPRPASYVR